MIETGLVLPGAPRIRVSDINPCTGTPARVVVSRARARPYDDLISSGRFWLLRLRGLFGIAKDEFVEFNGDARVIKDSSGNRIVHFQQLWHGRPIPKMIRTLVFSPKGRLLRIVGNNAPIKDAKIRRLPTTGPGKAVTQAAGALVQLGRSKDTSGVKLRKNVHKAFEELSRRPPRIETVFSDSTRSNVVDCGRVLGRASASLAYFPIDERLLLSWVIEFDLSEGGLRAIIGCDDNVCGEPLAVERLSNGAGVHGWVQTHPQEKPIEMRFESRWLDSGTMGPFAKSFVGKPANEQDEKRHMVTNIKARPRKTEEQAAINLFYFANRMHDFFLKYGFDEESGNFQNRKDGGGDDPITLIVEKRRNPGSYKHRVDGFAPMITMGRVVSGGLFAAFDPDIIIHEYAHGVAKRLVAGPQSENPFTSTHSNGFTEGLSDYFALSYHNYHHPNAQRFEWAGRSVQSQAALEALQRHRIPRDYRNAADRNFGELAAMGYAIGAGQSNGDTMYRIGEIWCSFLLELNRSFSAVFASPKKCQEFTWQLIIDGLKSMPFDPSLLQARMALDDVLRSRNDASHTRKLRRRLWRTCKAFGMGYGASSAGATLTGVVADNENMPPGL